MNPSYIFTCLCAAVLYVLFTSMTKRKEKAVEMEVEDHQQQAFLKASRAFRVDMRLPRAIGKYISSLEPDFSFAVPFTSPKLYF